MYFMPTTEGYFMFLKNPIMQETVVIRNPTLKNVPERVNCGKLF